MEADDQPKLSDSPSPASGDLDLAERNLKACLEAYDEEGEAGLQSELLRIHPNHGTFWEEVKDESGQTPGWIVRDRMRL